jgi:hypothetical protein
MAAVPTRDYAGAAIIFSVAAIVASYIVLSPLENLSFGQESSRAIFRDWTFVASAGLSAALSCHFLRPVARYLTGHQYFLRPFILGCLVVIVAHLLFGMIVSPVFEISKALTRDDYRFVADNFFIGAYLLSVGGLFAWFITVPIGILAAYCVEVAGWLREDARDRRSRSQGGGDQAKAVE